MLFGHQRRSAIVVEKILPPVIWMKVQYTASSRAVVVPQRDRLHRVPDSPTSIEHHEALAAKLESTYLGSNSATFLLAPPG